MKATTEEREATIAERNARYAVKFVSGGERAVAAELVAYSRGGNGGQLVELARDLWPLAYTHFDDIHHGRFVAGQSVGLENKQVKSVYTLAGQQGTADILNKEWVEGKSERPSVKLAKLKGHGWGNYPIVRGGKNAKGSKITWKARDGEGVAKRSILPTDKEHNRIIRMCNQLLVEAEEQRLYLLETNTQGAKRLKLDWKHRPSVRYIAIPQALGRVLVIHSEQKEGGEDVGEMCDGWGKEPLFYLVEGWMGNKPEAVAWAKGTRAARVQPCKGWGKRYSLAKGNNPESLAHAEEQKAAVASGKSVASFSVTSLSSPRTIADVLNSTVGEDGCSVDVAKSPRAEAETLIAADKISPLTAKQLEKLEAVEGKLGEIGTYVNTNKEAMSLTRQTAQENAPYTLPAQGHIQRNSPAETANPTTQRISRLKRKATAANEVQPC